MPMIIQDIQYHLVISLEDQQEFIIAPSDKKQEKKKHKH